MWVPNTRPAPLTWGFLEGRDGLATGPQLRRTHQRVPPSSLNHSPTANPSNARPRLDASTSRHALRGEQATTAHHAPERLLGTHTSQSPSTLVNIALVSLGSPLSRTRRTASAMGSLTEAPVPIGVMENAAIMPRSSRADRVAREVEARRVSCRLSCSGKTGEARGRVTRADYISCTRVRVAHETRGFERDPRPLFQRN